MRLMMHSQMSLKPNIHVARARMRYNIKYKNHENPRNKISKTK